jgi:hypothetical protein
MFEQADAQQTVLSTQFPLVHCAFVPHGCPFGTVTHIPPVQSPVPQS